MSELNKFESWCVVELFGHQKMAGYVREQALGGASFIRIDVPAAGGNPAFTRLLGASAIYAINPVSEEIARSEAARLQYAPVFAYTLPTAKALPGPDLDDDEEEDDQDPADDFTNPNDEPF